MPPSVSFSWASKPAETNTNCGAKASAAGRSFCSNASRYSLSPEPPGSGTLIVVFRPLPRPFSASVPEPG